MSLIVTKELKWEVHCSFCWHSLNWWLSLLKLSYRKDINLMKNLASKNKSMKNKQHYTVRTVKKNQQKCQRLINHSFFKIVLLIRKSRLKKLDTTRTKSHHYTFVFLNITRRTFSTISIFFMIQLFSSKYYKS